MSLYGGQCNCTPGLDIAHLYTKFDDSSLASAVHVIGAPKFRTVHVTLPCLKVDKRVVNCNQMCATSLGWRHLVNAYGVKAKWFIPLVDKRVGGR